MKIIEHRYWTMADIRQVCIANNLYTCGTNEEYANMFHRAEKIEPTPENLYIIAKDIAEHSEANTISNIMGLLTKAVMITYEIKETEHD